MPVFRILRTHCLTEEHFEKVFTASECLAHKRLNRFADRHTWFGVSLHVAPTAGTPFARDMGRSLAERSTRFQQETPIVGAPPVLGMAAFRVRSNPG